MQDGLHAVTGWVTGWVSVRSESTVECEWRTVSAGGDGAGDGELWARGQVAQRAAAVEEARDLRVGRASLYGDGAQPAGRRRLEVEDLVQVVEREQSATATLCDGRKRVATTDDATRRSGVLHAGLKFRERARHLHLSGTEVHVVGPVALQRLLVATHATRYRGCVRCAMRSAHDEGECAASSGPAQLSGEQCAAAVGGRCAPERQRGGTVHGSGAHADALSGVACKLDPWVRWFNP